jgi:hypothetical protein
MSERRPRSTGRHGRKIVSKSGKETLVITIPHEFAIGGVYLPPLLVASFFGVIASVITFRLLNRYRLSKYFFYPPLAAVSLMVIYTLLIGIFIIKV